MVSALDVTPTRLHHGQNGDTAQAMSQESVTAFSWPKCRRIGLRRHTIQRGAEDAHHL